MVILRHFPSHGWVSGYLDLLLLGLKVLPALNALNENNVIIILQKSCCIGCSRNVKTLYKFKIMTNGQNNVMIICILINAIGIGIQLSILNDS